MLILGCVLCSLEGVGVVFCASLVQRLAGGKPLVSLKHQYTGYYKTVYDSSGMALGKVAKHRAMVFKRGDTEPRIYH